MSLNKPAYRPLKEKVSITLDTDVAKELRRLAEEDQRSFSQYINRVLRQHIERKTKERVG